MKNAILTSAIAALFFALNISALAQTTATWQGGKPGRTTDWNCAANWREGKVPDEFSQVFILAGASYFPVIQTEVTSIDALLVEGGATLTLQRTANLEIRNETSRLGGLMLLGKIRNEGRLEIRNLSETTVALLTHIEGAGELLTFHLSEANDSTAAK